MNARQLASQPLYPPPPLHPPFSLSTFDLKQTSHLRPPFAAGQKLHPLEPRRRGSADGTAIWGTENRDRVTVGEDRRRHSFAVESVFKRTTGPISYSEHRDFFSAPSSPPSEEARGREGGGGEKTYSRSPELRISHKLAERRRRKEMKDMFDDLREILPIDKGTKTTKWEVLKEAIDYIHKLRRTRDSLTQEITLLRHQLCQTSLGEQAPARGALDSGTRDLRK
ncbi:uncharacterized protein VTP21DRAFT_10402 [Calcarisporiella thermophila]|uniref:uncharacterized protein n=1 Tax=Calcarisporiella thermophila TaxID=911321 RepID=UPI003742B23E